MKLTIAVATTLLLICMAHDTDAGALGTPPSAGQPDMTTLDAELNAIVRDPAHPLASLSVLAMHDGKVTYHKQFGHRFIDNVNPAESVPANAETMYRIASISKLITTLGAMKLVDEGRLSLDTDVSDYLGFQLRNPNFPKDPITLRMLLNHTSSLLDDAGYYGDSSRTAHFKEMLVPGGTKYGTGAMWAKVAKPGAHFQYANLPWGVVGSVMERVTGERFDRLMRRLILDPLSVKGGYHPADFLMDDLNNTATLYRKAVEVNDKRTWHPTGPWVAQTDNYRLEKPVPQADSDYVIGTNGTLFGPWGNCRLTATGLGTVMLMLMNEGMHDGKQILSRQRVNEMLSVQWRHDRKSRNGNSNGEAAYGDHLQAMNAWGLGAQIFLDLSGPGRGDRVVEGGGMNAVGHLGDAWGLTSAMLFDRAKKNGLIFMTGGPGFDPETYPGKYSSFFRHEEQILTALYRRAVVGCAPTAFKK